MKNLLLLVSVAAGLLIAAPAASPQPKTKAPGTRTYEWVARWLASSEQRVRSHVFKAPPALMKRVEVSIDGVRVAAPPYLGIVGCRNKAGSGVAQRTWLWNRGLVYVFLMLSPGRCDVAGKAVHVRVTLTSVGT
jgi:hypothetical protein